MSTVPIVDRCHCTAYVNFKGGPTRKQLLKDKFNLYGVMGRTKDSIDFPFTYFFRWLSEDFKCYGKLIHTLLLHKIPSTQEDEIHFSLNDTLCRFGKREFGLITGLKFFVKEDDTCIEFAGIRLIDRYFQNEDKIKFSRLEEEFVSCTDMEAVWRLGLVYFVEGVLLGVDDFKYIDTDLLSLVDVPAKFFRYPWGKTVFKATLKAFEKDMDSYCANHTESYTGSYTLCGWVPTLQYWAFETVPKLGENFAIYTGEKFPRMRSWKNKNTPPALKINEILKLPSLTVKPFLLPRPTKLKEVEYLLAHREIFDPAHFDAVAALVDVDLSVATTRVVDISAPDASAHSAHTPAPEAPGATAPVPVAPDAPTAPASDANAPAATASPVDTDAPAATAPAAATTASTAAATPTADADASVATADLDELRRLYSILEREIDELRRSNSLLTNKVESQYELIQSLGKLLQSDNGLFQSIHQKFELFLTTVSGLQPTTSPSQETTNTLDDPPRSPPRAEEDMTWKLVLRSSLYLKLNGSLPSRT